MVVAGHRGSLSNSGAVLDRPPGDAEPHLDAIRFYDHRVVNPFVLALLFFATIVPMGLVMRAFGRDALRLKLDKNATSYWILREPPGPSPETMKHQF